MEKLNTSKEAINNSHILELLKSDNGFLMAIKYVKECSNWMLKECKEYVENIRKSKILSIGTISWFRCEDQLPPIKHEDYLGKPSEMVLVWGPNGFPIQTYYVHSVKTWFSSNNIPFEITHWAFINTPIVEEQEREYANNSNDASIVEIFKG